MNHLNKANKSGLNLTAKDGLMSATLIFVGSTVPPPTDTVSVNAPPRVPDCWIVVIVGRDTPIYQGENASTAGCVTFADGSENW